MLNNFIIENSIKQKFNVLEKLGQDLCIVGKPLVSGILWT
jgi:hypothetical protein